MSDILRICLFVGAVITLVFFFREIAKSRMQIGSAVSWSVFSFMLVILAIFPQIVIEGARILKIDSPANLLFLMILCILIFQLFLSSVKISKLEQKVELLAQHIALEKWKADREKESISKE